MMRSRFLQFNVISPGLYTTVQDNGRRGFQNFGIPITGVLDSFSAQIANFLVGNDRGCAVLELTVLGPHLLAMNDAYVAITGADLEITLNNNKVSTWSAFRVRPGDRLEIGQVKSGCRGYLAITGGIQTERVMGSQSCYVGGRFGGIDGRPLKAGDKIARGPGEFFEQPRNLPEELIPAYSKEIVLRAIPGPQDDYFDRGLGTFFSSEFVVTPDANRIGYRLAGPVIKQKERMPTSIISESSLPGGVQIPPNGQPIILLGEQTVGGYSKIATVISADLDRIGQAMPDSRIRFEKVDLEMAYSIKKDKAEEMERTKKIIDLVAIVKHGRNKNPIYEYDQTLELFKELYPEC
jgi:biotin-dependent carboxylase-like uncharacterized protein